MMKTCSICEKNTYIENNKYEHWYRSKVDNKPICKRCYDKHIRDQDKFKAAQKKIRDGRIKFKSIRKNVRIIRTGVCNLCRSVVPFDCQRTHIHHEEYHNDDLTKDTMEICPKCHFYITKPYQ